MKLGYGGTKSEMERLLADAQKLTGVKYDINNLSDVYEAVHIIQNELGITGTTAEEATDTLLGSIGMLKASWENFLSGSGDLSKVVENVTITSKNVIRIVSEAIPEIIDNLVEALPEFLELGVDIVQKLLNGIINNLPQLLEMGMQIIIQLINGIAEQLPDLIPIMVDTVLLIVDTLIDNIDLLIDAGIELILALADGLIEALPQLIEKAPEIIQKLVDALIRNFPKIVMAGGELIGKLVMGIIGSSAKLLEKAPELIKILVDGLKRGWNEIKNVGNYLVEGLWNGITGMAGWLARKIRSFASNIIGNIKSALGIHSPSRIMRDEVGKMLPRGIAVGIEADTDSAIKAIDQMNDDIMDRMNKAVNVETAKASFKGTSGSVSEILNANNTIRVENYNTLELDGEKVYENQQNIQKNKNLQYSFGGAY